MASNGQQGGFEPGNDQVQVPREPYFRPPHLESATGQLFAGAGKFVDDLASVADTYFKNTIDYQARNEATIVRDASNAAAQMIVNPQGVEKAVGSGAPIPDAISDKTVQAQGLTAAKGMGKLNDSNYWAQMDLIARNLRSSYPGYRDFIDDTMAKITGQIPANALHKALDAQLQQLGQNQANTAQRIAHIEDRLAEGGLSVRNDPEYKNIVAAGDANKQLDWLNYTESQRNMYKAQTQANHAILSNDKLKLEVNDMAGSQAYSQAATENLMQFMERLKADPKYQDVVQKLTAAQNKEARGEMLQPQERAEIMGTFNQIRQEFMANVHAPFKAKMSGGISPSKVAEVDKNVTSWFDAMMHGVDHPGFIKSQEDILNSRKHGAEWNLLSQNQAIETYSALNRALGPQTASLALQDPKNVGPFVNTVANAIHAKVVSGNVSSLDESFKLASKAGFDSPKQYDALLDKSLVTLGDKKVPSTGASPVFDHIFSNQNKSYIANLPESQRVNYYTKILASPNLDNYEKLWKDGKISNDQMKTVLPWAEDSASLILRDQFNVLNRFSAMSKAYSVEFNPQLFMFQLKRNTSRGDEAPVTVGDMTTPIPGDMRPPAEVINNINKVLMSLHQAAVKDGSRDPETVIDGVLRRGMYAAGPSKGATSSSYYNPYEELVKSMETAKQQSKQPNNQ